MNQEFKDALDALKTSLQDETKAQIEALKKESEDANKAKIEDLESKLVAVQNKYDEMKGKLENPANPLPTADKGLLADYRAFATKILEECTSKTGERDFGALKASKPFEIGIKAVQTTTTALNTASIFLTEREIDREIHKAPRNPNTILELIKVRPTKAMTIHWRYKDTSVGAGPGTVAEGGAFPERELRYLDGSEKVKKIAVFSEFSAETIEDSDFFETELPLELSEDMLSVLNTQCFAGDGTGNNLNGLKTIATAFARPAGVGTMTGVKRADVLRIAILILRKANFIPNAIVLNPTDAAMMELEKDTTGQYILPPFIAADGMKVKGLPVIEDNNQTEGDFFIGDFSKAVLRVKRQLEYKLFDQDAQNAKNDQYTATMSMRAALVVPHPKRKAFVKGTFSTAITALQA